MSNIAKLVDEVIKTKDAEIFRLSHKCGNLITDNGVLEAKVEGLEKENEHLTEIVEHNKISSTMMNRKVEGLEKLSVDRLESMKEMQARIEKYVAFEKKLKDIEFYKKNPKEFCEDINNGT